MEELRKELKELRDQKRVAFHDLDRLIKRIVHKHAELFPDFDIKQKGARVVYHFNVTDVYPISLEREHRGRDCILPKFAKIAMNLIEEVLSYVENQP